MTEYTLSISGVVATCGNQFIEGVLLKRRLLQMARVPETFRHADGLIYRYHPVHARGSRKGCGMTDLDIVDLADSPDFYLQPVPVS